METKDTIRLMTVAQFASLHPAFSQASLRHLIYNARNNRFSSVIKRIGKRKVLIDEEAFFKWVQAQQSHEGGLS